MVLTGLPFEKKPVPPRQEPPPRPEVLVVVGTGGVVEVYVNQRMRCHIAKKLNGLPNTIEAELLSEEYMELRLPRWAQELFAPENLRKSETVRLLRPSEEIERRVRVALVRECREIMEERNGKKQANGGRAGVPEVPR